MRDDEAAREHVRELREKATLRPTDLVWFLSGNMPSWAYKELGATPQFRLLVLEQPDLQKTWEAMRREVVSAGSEEERLRSMGRRGMKKMEARHERLFMRDSKRALGLADAVVRARAGATSFADTVLYYALAVTGRNRPREVQRRLRQGG